MSFKFGGSGGGGGAGDTYTASTATAAIPVENGRLYALSSTGTLVPSSMEIESSGEYIGNPTAVAGYSAYENQNGVYGDMITPDGVASFHFTTDVTSSNGQHGVFYISLDNGATNNGPVFDSSTGDPFSDEIGWNGARSEIHLKLIGEETDYWFYAMFIYSVEAGGGQQHGRGFMVKKADHKLHTTGTTSFVGGQSPEWLAQQNVPNGYRLDLEVGRQSKFFMFSCRNSTKFVYTNPSPNGTTEKPGWMFYAQDTYRSSDSSYWGGTSMGLPKLSGQAYSGVTHRDNAKQDTHQPLFKVDDANGIFVAPYYAGAGSNNGQYVFIKYTVNANTTITEASEVLVTGTDPSDINAGNGHWIATSNPLIFYLTYNETATTVKYAKLTFNADWTAAAWSAQATLTISTAMDSGVYGYWNWGFADPLNSVQAVIVKHSFPSKELFFMTGANSAAKNTVVLSFPASGDPSELGLTTLNNTLSGVYGTKMIMQSMNSDSMISISHPWVSGGNFDRGEQGYAIYYTDHFNPNFKKTVGEVAIARADGVIGATVNIDLKSGDTASTTLSSNYYLTKEGMSYPLDVEGGAPLAPSVIKSVQRGVAYLGNSTQVGYAGESVTISPVNLNKSFCTISMGPTYNNVTSIGRGRLSSSTTVTFNLIADNAAAYWNWEVIEYV